MRPARRCALRARGVVVPVLDGANRLPQAPGVRGGPPRPRRSGAQLPITKGPGCRPSRDRIQPVPLDPGLPPWHRGVFRPIPQDVWPPPRCAVDGDRLKLNREPPFAAKGCMAESGGIRSLANTCADEVAPKADMVEGTIVGRREIKTRLAKNKQVSADLGDVGFCDFRQVRMRRLPSSYPDSGGRLASGDTHAGALIGAPTAIRAARRWC
jgi:hypothetical protein